MRIPIRKNADGTVSIIPSDEGQDVVKYDFTDKHALTESDRTALGPAGAKLMEALIELFHESKPS